MPKLHPSILFFLFLVPGAAAHSQPEVQQTFDRKAVVQLISEIDKPRNASTLKVAYFLSRSRMRSRLASDELPIDQGWQLLTQAASQELRGSKRWFIYKDVIGYVGLRLPSVSKKEGFFAYDNLFDDVEKASIVNATYYARQAVSEFVNSIPFTFDQTGLNDSLEMPKTFVKAWKAFILLEKNPKTNSSVTPRVDWIAALDKGGTPKELKTVLDQELADKSTRKSYDFLSVLGHVLRFEEPRRAVDFLKQAKDLLPAPETADRKEVNRLYSELIEALQRNHQDEEALNCSKEQVTKYNSGRANFIAQLSDQDKENEIQGVLDDAGRKDIPDEELNAVIDVVDELSRDIDEDVVVDKPLALGLAKLLENKLKVAPSQSSARELRMRLKLAAVYHSLNDDDKAQAALDIPAKEPSNSEEARLWKQIESNRKKYMQAQNDNAERDK